MTGNERGGGFSNKPGIMAALKKKMESLFMCPSLWVDEPPQTGPPTSE